MYFEIVDHLNTVLAETISTLTPETPFDAASCTFVATKDTTHGDLTTNAAMVLAKTLKKNPREIAAMFQEKLTASPHVEKVMIAGPGFINIRLSGTVLIDTLKSILKEKEHYGRSFRFSGKKALVEFVSANPTGPLHVGHVRGAVVGDTTAELLRAVGYEVTREYYYNDAGVQMQMLGRSVQARYRQLFGVDSPLPENGYKGDYIRYIAAGLKSSRGDSLLREEKWEPFTEYAADVLMNIIMDDLRRLRVLFDATFSERSLHTSGAVARTLKQLAEKGATYEQDGAIWLRTTDHGDEKDRVLVKSDGEPTYVTPDIAYHCDKYDRGFDLLVNVMGHDHHSQVERVKTALRIFGHNLDRLQYLLNQMVSIQREGEKVKLSTREGQFMTLAEMVDELGADVTRYFFAQRSYKAQMIFDWDLAKKQSMDNPVYYLQYVHARACSMEEKAIERGIGVSPAMEFDTSILMGEKERLLLLKLFYYPSFVSDAAERFETQLIPTYLEDLAKMFHTYYQAQRVLDQDDPAGSLARFHLVLAIRQVMRNGLGLLRVNAPERM
ncbi:MAG: arginine--tRNA ligase [Candidatus Omnitrophota bacterium]|jgi:arginyl-tRNA synthetase|nr:MAG: arginine--tRNA ligase [Candidatus Omnitrophota bacterium]